MFKVRPIYTFLTHFLNITVLSGFKLKLNHLSLVYKIYLLNAKGFIIWSYDVINNF